ncbi:MAG: 50S ribosomal protein L31e [Candidatus Bathyarchaeales archaeon]
MRKEEVKAEETASKVDDEAVDTRVSEEKATDEIKELLEEEPAEGAAAAEEEEVAPRKREKEEGEEIVEERIYTIPLVKALARPPNKRAPRAIQLIREFIIKHMKLEIPVEAEEEKEELPKLVISNEVNEKVWSRGIEKPPRKIRVRAAKDKDGNVTLYLAEGE